MKLAILRCPSCGAQLTVDSDNKQATCDFCNATFPIDNEVQHVQYDNVAQAGYEFEKGRQRALAEQQELEAKQQRAAYALAEEERRRREFDERERREARERERAAARQRQIEEQARQREENSAKAKRGCLWACGWLLFFPAPLSILIYRSLRKKGISDTTSKIVLAVGWILFIIPPYLIPRDADGNLISSMVFIPFLIWIVGFAALSIFVHRNASGSNNEDD